MHVQHSVWTDCTQRLYIHTYLIQQLEDFLSCSCCGFFSFIRICILKYPNQLCIQQITRINTSSTAILREVSGERRVNRIQHPPPGKDILNKHILAWTTFVVQVLKEEIIMLMTVSKTAVIAIAFVIGSSGSWKSEGTIKTSDHEEQLKLARRKHNPPAHLKRKWAHNTRTRYS